MRNLIKNPNINSKHLFRADILFDSNASPLLPVHMLSPSHNDENFRPKPISITGYDPTWTVVRRLIPRKPEIDSPLKQTCIWLCGHHPAIDNQTVDKDGEECTLVIYIPHVASATEIPWYHPAVRGVAWLYTEKRQ